MKMAPHLLRAQIEPWGNNLAQFGRSPNTVTAYMGDMNKLVDWYHDHQLDPFPEFSDLAAAYVTMNKAGMANASVVRSMSAVRSFRTYCEANTDLELDEPFVGYKTPARYRPTAHPLPRGMLDVDAMVDSAWRPHHKILVGLCGYAGLRITEARSVTPRSLMQDADGDWWLTIWGKGGVYREVPVSDKLLYILDTFAVRSLADEPDTPYVATKDRGARSAITDIGARAGVSRKVSSHDLRHTFGTDIYNRTKDLRVTQELMGHSSSQTTEGYTGVAQAQKNAALG